MPIDILAGTDKIRKDIEKGGSLKQIEEWWEEQRLRFQKQTRKHSLLYK
jgi:uncharacterized protein YbbC (DUF1343 family)